jgi:hypothetical protein
MRQWKHGVDMCSKLTRIEQTGDLGESRSGGSNRDQVERHTGLGRKLSAELLVPGKERNHLALMFHSPKGMSQNVFSYGVQHDVNALDIILKRLLGSAFAARFTRLSESRP